MLDIINLSHNADYKCEEKTCLAIGNFDGIHLAHKQIIEQLVEISKEKNLMPAILTFEPHPASYFKPELKNYRITKLEDKFFILSELGLEKLFAIGFDESFSKLSAEHFIDEIIINQLNAAHVITGEDFKFGHNRTGNATTLATHLAQKQIIYAPQRLLNADNNSKISSTNIRSLISAGQIEQANALLTQNFAISGKVVEGQRLGKTIGFPTANLSLDNYIIPAYGVYKTRTTFVENGKTYNSISNIGVRPTVTEGSPPTLETFIFDFAEDIYHKEIKVELLKYIRPEIKFSSITELQEQIKKDIANATEQ